MPKFRLKKGYTKFYTHGSDGKLVRYGAGEIIECPAEVVAAHMDRLEPVESAEAEKPLPTKIARKRPDGLFDVFNILNGTKLNEKPLTETDAGLIADEFAEETSPEVKPFAIQKIADAVPGQPSFNVVDTATGEPVNAEPLVKKDAQSLLAQKLELAANA